MLEEIVPVLNSDPQFSINEINLISVSDVSSLSRSDTDLPVNKVPSIIASTQDCNDNPPRFGADLLKTADPSRH